METTVGSRVGTDETNVTGINEGNCDGTAVWVGLLVLIGALVARTGAAEGSNDGALVDGETVLGASVGLTEGSRLGTSDVGVTVGAIEGVVDGACDVGAGVGAVVGVSEVGLNVGTKLGAAVGTMVGPMLGATVGPVVGTSELGVVVGTTVG